MNEPARALNWLITTLGAATASTAPGGVWEGMAPLSVTATPYIVVQMQSNADVLGIAGVRLWSHQTWQVKAVGPTQTAGDYATLQAAADALDAALQRQSGIASDGTPIQSCVRIRALALPELQKDGALWNNLGGLYEIDVAA